MDNFGEIVESTRNIMNISVLRPHNPMAANPIFKSAYDKFKLYVEKHYNLKMNYKPFSQKQTSSDKVLQSLLVKNDYLSFVNKALFPVLLHDTVIGAIELLSENRINVTDLKKISSVKDIIFPCDMLSQTSNVIKIPQPSRKELTLMGVSFFNKNDIYEMYESRTNTKSVDDDDFFISFNNNISNDPNRKLNDYDFSCFINSESQEDNFRIAHELHLNSQRYAFLSLSDIHIADRTVEGLNSLGSISIYISDLNKLSDLEIKVIDEILQQPVACGSPQFYFGLSYSTSYNQLSFAVQQMLNRHRVVHIFMPAELKNVGLLHVLEKYKKAVASKKL